MNKIIIIALLSVFTFSSCNSEKKAENDMKNTVESVTQTGENAAEVAAKFATTGNELKIVAIITLEDGVMEEILPLYAKLVAGSQAEEGCLYYDFHKDVNDPTNTKFVMVELWKDQAAIDSHNVAPHIKEFQAASKGKVKSSEVMVVKLMK